MSRIAVIDDRGRVWGANTVAQHHGLASGETPKQLVGHLVAHLGYAQLDFRGDTCRLRFAPSVASRVALTKAITEVEKYRCSRIVISIFNQDWTDQIFGSLQAAVLFIYTALEAQDNARAGQFRRHMLSIDDIARNHVLREVVGLWKRHGPHLKVDALRPLMEAHLQGRFLILDVRAERDNLIFSSFGHGYETFDARWGDVARGLRFEDQPDIRYARFAAIGYREALSSGQPLFDHLDVVVSRPQLGKFPSRYARLILPLNGKGGRQLLSASTTNLPSAIDRKAFGKLGQI